MEDSIGQREIKAKLRFLLALEKEGSLELRWLLVADKTLWAMLHFSSRFPNTSLGNAGPLYGAKRSGYEPSMQVNHANSADLVTVKRQGSRHVDARQILSSSLFLTMSLYISLL